LQANIAQKQAGIAICISDKADFIPKLVRKDKQGHSTLTKGAIYQKHLTVINICGPNIGKPNFIKETVLHIKTQTLIQ
jgi:hypothetical protein